MASIVAITPKGIDRQDTDQEQEFVVDNQTVSVQREERSALQTANRLGQTLTTGAADLLGFPVDLVNSVLPERFQQVGGSEDFREWGAKLGLTLKPGERPETFSERVVYELGAAALPTGAVLRGGRAATSATNALSRSAQETTRRVGSLTQFSRQAAQKPLSFVSAEATAATAAGVGGGVANYIFPDSETAETVGQLVGGFAPSMLTSLPSLSQMAISGAKFVTSPITGYRGRQRAARRLQQEVADPAVAASEIQRQQGRGLSPARASGEENLIGLENLVRKKYPEIEGQISEQLAESVDGLVREAREIGNLSGQERVTEILRNRREYLLNSLEVSSARAGEAYAASLARLGSDADSRQIQAAFDTTVGTAYDQARASERQLWSNVQDNAIGNIDGTRLYLNEELANRSEAADPSDIPGYVRRLISPRTAGEVDTSIELTPAQRQEVSRLDDESRISVRYIQDFRSRVLQDIRRERAKDAPNRNKIRILSGLQENLLNDMRSAEGQSDAIDSALAYSRDLNQRFMQGKVGEMLGFRASGASRVAPEDSIQFILSGGRASSSATNVRQVLNAVPEAAGDVSNYLKNQYAVSTLNADGTINQSRSRRFFEKYRNVMDAIPGLRADIEGAAQTGQRQQDLLNRKNRLMAIVSSPQKSALSLWLDEPVEEAMSRVIKSKNPVVLAANLRRRVQQDPLALEGLKSSYIEHILRRGLTGNLDPETGENIVNGSRLLNELSNTTSTAKALGFSDAEIKRAEDIFRSISRANRKGPPAQNVARGEIVGDIQNYFMDSIAAFLGARAGSMVPTANAGVSIQQAARGSTALQKVFRFLSRDKAEEILIDAMTDDQLFRDLLITPTSSPVRKDRLARRLRAYIPSAAMNEIEQDEERQVETGSGPRIEAIDTDTSPMPDVLPSTEGQQ